MLALFRKIRKKYADDNQFLKYGRYAIGEIVLVVIGILIALQINTWSEKNQIKIEEQQALRNLAIDFEKNKADIQELIDASKTSLNTSLTILNYTGDKSIEILEKDFDSLLLGVYFIQQFYAANGSLDDLLNSGKLSIIQNSELRKSFSVWKSSLVELRDWELKSNNIEDKIVSYISKHGSWLNTDEVSKSVKTYSLPKSGFEIDNRALLKEIQFENLIESRIIVLEEVNITQNKLLIITIEILQIIQKEMNKTS